MLITFYSIPVSLTETDYTFPSHSWHYDVDNNQMSLSYGYPNHLNLLNPFMREFENYQGDLVFLLLQKQQGEVQCLKYVSDGYYNDYKLHPPKLTSLRAYTRKVYTSTSFNFQKLTFLEVYNP